MLKLCSGKEEELLSEEGNFLDLLSSAIQEKWPHGMEVEDLWKLLSDVEKKGLSFSHLFQRVVQEDWETWYDEVPDEYFSFLMELKSFPVERLEAQLQDVHFLIDQESPMKEEWRRIRNEFTRNWEKWKNEIAVQLRKEVECSVLSVVSK